MPPIRSANALSTSRDYVGAERFYRLALAGEPNNGTLLTNLALLYTASAACDVRLRVALMASRSASFPIGAYSRDEHVEPARLRRAERLARAHADSAQPRDALDCAGRDCVGLAVARGRLHEGERRFAQVNDAKARVRGDTVSPDVVAYCRRCSTASFAAMRLAALAALDAALRKTPVASVPMEHDQSIWLAWPTRDSAPRRKRARC